VHTGGRPYRPPVGIPGAGEGRWRGVVVSVLFHALVVALLLVPAVAAVIVHTDRRSAGLRGLFGGGGGRGRLQETLHYLTTPEPPKVPVKPPPTPPPKPPPPTSSVAPVAPAAAETTRVVADGGTPGDSGPGRGGGTGAGEGTGVGNGTGPGVGGTGGTKIHARTDFFAIPAGLVPKRPRPFHLHAVFAVTARGDATLLSITKADDGDFNRQVRDALMETHFKPATMPDGTPVADTVPIDIDY
jgi:hypothetical protein